ncbi:hypothetical protein [Streptomyces sp. HPF1205]|uniref:hypothetical protein n=1 Tax=Streptomyces sp. HPF1205 TaxID=2873262 RepID=UPI0035AB881C
MRQRTGSHTSEPTPEGSASPPDCDMVTVPARQGLEAADLLRLSHGGVGPVLHDRTGDSLAFLVPPGTAEAWDVPGSECTHPGGQPPAPHAGWLVPPRTDIAVTDPAVLRAALGAAARTLRLADGIGCAGGRETPGCTTGREGAAAGGSGPDGIGAGGSMPVGSGTGGSGTGGSMPVGSGPDAGGGKERRAAAPGDADPR